MEKNNPVNFDRWQKKKKWIAHAGKSTEFFVFDTIKNQQLHACGGRQRSDFVTESNKKKITKWMSRNNRQTASNPSFARFTLMARHRHSMRCHMKLIPNTRHTTSWAYIALFLSPSTNTASCRHRRRFCFCCCFSSIHTIFFLYIHTLNVKWETEKKRKFM